MKIITWVSLKMIQWDFQVLLAIVQRQILNMKCLAFIHTTFRKEKI